MSSWIWLSPSEYPDRQTCACRTYGEPRPDGQRFTVAQFKKDFAFSQPVKRVQFLASGDTAFSIQLNGNTLWNGPASMGSDWLALPSFPPYYADQVTWESDGSTALAIQSTVRLSPTRASDQSRRHGGFTLEADVTFQDGTTTHIETDSTWLCRVLHAFDDPRAIDMTKPPSQWLPATEIQDIWRPIPSPIPVCSQATILPTTPTTLEIPAGQTATHVVLFDKIHAAFPCLEASARCNVQCKGFERDPQNLSYGLTVTLDKESPFRDTSLSSIGGMTLIITNLSQETLLLKPSLISSCYPISQQGHFICSDNALNNVYDVCKWTTQICRQNLHLDSPKHQEPLACTGDYYIESMITAFAFGDMRLAAFDILRTAQVLEILDGRIFHTTYSLIWVNWLWETYQFTGDKKLLSDCRHALDLLLKRFKTYRGNNGIVDNPPDYMFVDWLVVDGFSMHHPPKYLGQTVLNAFYHGALQTAACIYRELDGANSPDALAVTHDALALKNACRTLLYDPMQKLFIDGLGTPSGEPSQYHPQNENRRHFSRHANVLAVLYGLVTGDEATDLLRRTLESDLPEVQPYFMHFVLNAVWKQGLFEQFGMKILALWKPLAEECSKGLKEGWFPPEPTYSFDYSHAWAGTAAYQLPARLLGFDMLEPGFKKFTLRPRLFGLQSADIAMPTPFGMLRVQMKQGERPVISMPPALQDCCTVLERG